MASTAKQPSAELLATVAAPIYAAHLSRFMATSGDDDSMDSERLVEDLVETAWHIWRRAAEVVGEHSAGHA